MWQDALNDILALPRAKRREALKQLRKHLPSDPSEEWNTTFGANSLYEAWSTVGPMQGIYEHNRDVIRKYLEGRDAWHVVEVGGGNGALWRGFFGESAQGTFTLVDPVADAHEAVASALPEGVVFQAVVAPVETVNISEADVLVCSLMLHHVAGLDVEQRYGYGLIGPGKHELLQGFLRCVRSRDGICILNESDIYTELDLPPEDPILMDRLIDSYISRAGMAVAAALAQPGLDSSLKHRLEAILLRWCIDQVELAGTCPRAERDVYELDTPCWKRVLERAEARILSHRFTDDWNLFHQWVLA